ncbi:hypothetical protein JTB14_007647 [Gonioctena quinquepunctata]|nr:hypothetical protein JTB14_007647 [Gonioctena quinquepunctata]
MAEEDENIDCYIKNSKFHVTEKFIELRTWNKAKRVGDLEQSEKVDEIEEKATSAPGTPSAQNHTKEIPKLFEKSLVTNTRNQRQTSTASPSTPPTGTVKKSQTKKDPEDRTRIETRSEVPKKLTRNTNNS